MNYSMRMDILKSLNDTGNNEFYIDKYCTSLFFVKVLIEAHMISKISASQIFHDQVKVLSILESCVSIYNEGIS